MSGPWEEATIQRGQFPGPLHRDVSVCWTGLLLHLVALGESSWVKHLTYLFLDTNGRERQRTPGLPPISSSSGSPSREEEMTARARAGKRCSLGQIQPAACFCKALLEHSHIHLFTHLWLLLCYRSKVEALRQRPYGPQSL